MVAFEVDVASDVVVLLLMDVEKVVSTFLRQNYHPQLPGMTAPVSVLVEVAVILTLLLKLVSEMVVPLV